MEHFILYRELEQERKTDNSKLWKDNRKLCREEITRLNENSKTKSKNDSPSNLKNRPSSSSSSSSSSATAAASIKKHPIKRFQFEITSKDQGTKYYNKEVLIFPTVKRGPFETLWNEIPCNIRLLKKAPLDDNDKDSDESEYEDDEDDSANEFQIKETDREKIYSLDIIRDQQLFIKFVHCLYDKLRTSNNDSVFVEKQNDSPSLSEIKSVGVFNVISSMFSNSDLPPYKLKDWYVHLIRGRKPQGSNKNILLGTSRYHKLFCRRCYVYNCLIHSEKEKVRVDSCAPRPETINPLQPCTENCYLHSQGSMSNDEMDSSGIKLGSSPSSDSEEEEEVEVLGTSSTAILLSSSKLNEAKKMLRENIKIPIKCNNRWDDELQPPEISRNTNKNREVEEVNENGGFSPISSDENELVSGRKNPRKPSVMKLAKGNSGYKGLYSPIHSDENFSDESEQHGSPTVVESNLWSPEEVTLLAALHKVYPYNFCKIAIILQTKNCKQVKQYIDLHPENFAKNLLFKKPKHLKRATGKTMNAWLTVRDKKELDVALPVEDRSVPRYVPCFHPGMNCNDECACMKKKVPCEKFCCCATMDNIKCSIRFPGCTCYSLNCCVKNTCSCRSAGRECDIDLCRCGIVQEGSSVSLISCKNVDIQTKKGKKVKQNSSKVHGIGLYADEDFKKGDFVGEYTGEIISNHETERRSDRYNQIQSTYLFERNKAESIDSMYFGNALRFTNSSSSTTKANTKASRKYVYGDSRIALYAVEDIKKGQELFFDYQNALKTQRAPGNYKSLPVKRVKRANCDDDDFAPIRKNVAKKTVVREPSSLNSESSSNEDSSGD